MKEKWEKRFITFCFTLGIIALLDLEGILILLISYYVFNFDFEWIYEIPSIILFSSLGIQFCVIMYYYNKKFKYYFFNKFNLGDYNIY
jgi:hypothetical protein